MYYEWHQVKVKQSTYHLYRPISQQTDEKQGSNARHYSMYYFVFLLLSHTTATALNSLFL